MKKILLTVAVLLLSASMTFAARNGGMDLVDIFGKNQLGAGYDKREWDTSLYSDFGTDKLRFSVNLWRIGGSWYNNGEITKDGSAVPFQNGLPVFFVGAGYKFSDSFRAAIGYGGVLTKNNESTEDLSVESTDKTKANGYYGHDISVFVQADVGGNIIRFATPVQFGKGFGNKLIRKEDGPPAHDYGYNMKGVSVFSMAPEIRWLGQLGPLVQVRFAVPFGMATVKSAKLFDTDTTYQEEVKGSTIGAELRVYLRFATDPVLVQFVPRVIYKQAIKGNNLSINAIEEGFNTFEGAPINNSDIGYTMEKPWSVRVDLPIDLTASSDMVTIWGAPQVRFHALGAPKLVTSTSPAGIQRHTPIYGIGYALPLELTVRPIANLEFNIGMEVEAIHSVFKNGKADANASVDGGIVWYF